MDHEHPHAARDRTAFAVFAGLAVGGAAALVATALLNPPPPAPLHGDGADAPALTPDAAAVAGAAAAGAPSPGPASTGPSSPPPVAVALNWTATVREQPVQWVESGTADLALAGGGTARVVVWELAAPWRWAAKDPAAVGDPPLPLGELLADEYLRERLAPWPLVVAVGLSAAEGEGLSAARATALAVALRPVAPTARVLALDVGDFAGGADANRPLRLLGLARLDGAIMSDEALLSLVHDPALGPLLGSAGGEPFAGYGTPRLLPEGAPSP